MPSLFGVKIIESEHVRPVPNVLFDPERKCDAWAPPAYRAQVDAWLLGRFGAHQVAYIFDSAATGRGVLISPQHAAMLRNLSRPL